MSNSGDQTGLRTKILDLGLSLGLGVRYCSRFWSRRFGLGFRLEGLLLLKQAPSYCFLSTLLHLIVFYVLLTSTVMSWCTTNNNTVTSETLEEMTLELPTTRVTAG